MDDGAYWPARHSRSGRDSSGMVPKLGHQGRDPDTADEDATTGHSDPGRNPSGVMTTKFGPLGCNPPRSEIEEEALRMRMRMRMRWR